MPYDPYTTWPHLKDKGRLNVRLAWLCVVAFSLTVALIVLAAVCALS